MIIMSDSTSVGNFNAYCNTHAYPTKKHHVLDLTDEQIDQIRIWMEPPTKGRYSQTIDECWIEV